MKLDFSTLSRPKAPPPSLKAWGQVGTAGTAISMRSSARSDSGDAAGTSGDAHPHDPACPQVSPDCPHPSTACKPNSHAVSPMSPGVPTYLKQTIHGDGFYVAGTQADVLALTAARGHLFTRRGLDEAEAEKSADGLVIRDRGGDDRRLCLECQHLRGIGPYRCGNARAADVHADVARDLVLTLQRCHGYLDACLPIEKTADAGHQHE